MKKINKRNLAIIFLLIIIICAGAIIYKLNSKIKKEAINKSEVKNIIYMIGDGMGEKHIIAGELYKNKQLNMQTIKNKSYVTTHSTKEVTDSAAAATALATGYKTNNGIIGKDQYGNNVENLIEYTNKKGLKTGIICTQILCHATPASFSVHNNSRHNYDEIAKSQIESKIDLMFGGGRKYFSKYQSEMKSNNFKWINSLEELNNINKNERIIGTFSEESISKENNRITLKEMTKQAISTLENQNGFFVMIEGSDIDTYSHESDMSKMLNEVIDFDDAIGIAKQYVDEHPNTLLIVTADHETGGLTLDGVNTAKELSNSLFKSKGQHTSANVPIFAYGAKAKELTKDKVIDNTFICKFIIQSLD